MRRWNWREVAMIGKWIRSAYDRLCERIERGTDRIEAENENLREELDRATQERRARESVELKRDIAEMEAKLNRPHEKRP